MVAQVGTYLTAAATGGGTAATGGGSASATDSLTMAITSAAGANPIDSLKLTLCAFGSAAAGAIGHAFAIGRLGTKILVRSPEWNDY